MQTIARYLRSVAGFVEEGREDSSVAAVFCEGVADWEVSFEDSEADGGGGHSVEEDS